MVIQGIKVMINYSFFLIQGVIAWPRLTFRLVYSIIWP